MNWLRKNWRSVTGGALTLGLAGYGIYRNPASLADPKTMALLISGLTAIGLNESGSTKPPQAPAQ